MYSLGTALMESTVGLIYETVADPALWGKVMRAVGFKVGTTAARIFQLGTHGRSAFLAVDDIAPSLVSAYGAHFQRIDPLAREWQRRPYQCHPRRADSRSGTEAAELDRPP